MLEEMECSNLSEEMTNDLMDGTNALMLSNTPESLDADLLRVALLVIHGRPPTH